MNKDNTLKKLENVLSGVKGDASQVESNDTDLDYDDMDAEDSEVIDNGRVSDIFQRIQTKVERKPSIKRGYYYRVLVKDLIRAVEDKPGAPTALLSAMRDFLKTQL